MDNGGIGLSDILLLGGVLLLLAVLWKWQRDPTDEFDLRWLLVDSATGKVSLFKVGQFVALFVSTWAMIYETRHGHLTEWLFGVYMLSWSGANVANKLVEKYKSPEVK